MISLVATEEKLVTLPNITWEQFKGIESQLENNRAVRLTYLKGALEIVSPIGEKHEEVKSTLRLLLERSTFLPDLDPALLLRYLRMPDQYDAVNEFMQDIRF